MASKTARLKKRRGRVNTAPDFFQSVPGPSELFERPQLTPLDPHAAGTAGTYARLIRDARLCPIPVRECVRHRVIAGRPGRMTFPVLPAPAFYDRFRDDIHAADMAGLIDFS